jgi:hypothetical protein
MATRIAAANGNFLTGATWQDVDATSLLVSILGNTNLTTSYVTSATFTPGAITIDGIAVWVNTRLGSTGTMSVALDQAGSDVAGTPVTINVADIPAGGDCWVFFKFAAPVALAAATLYSVKAKTSSATQVNLFRNATAGNWSRLLRTTTTGAPAAADPLYILGEKTGAGTGNTITVTMDDAAAGATVYGQIDVSAGGTLAFGVVAGVAYYLKLAGDLYNHSGGTFKMGDVGSAMPTTSSAVLEFNCGSNVQYGMKGGGTWIGQGDPIANVKAKLNANAAATATSLTTDISTGWKNGDEIGIASTTQTASEREKKSLTANASGTTLTIAALTNAHGGVAPIVAELINLTRNVKIRGISTSLQAYWLMPVAGTTVDFDYVEISNMGSGTTDKRGIDINIGVAGGDVSFQYCAFHDWAVASSGLLINVTTMLNGPIYFNHNVAYNLKGRHFYLANRQIGTGSISLLDHLAIGDGDSGAVELNNPSINVQDLTVTSTGDSAIALIGNSDQLIGTFKNIVAHSNANGGIFIQAATSVSGNSGLHSDRNTDIQNLTSWRNTGNGMGLGQSGGVLMDIHIGGTTTIFGNSSRGMYTSGFMINCSFADLNVYAGTVLTQPIGWTIGDSGGGAQQNMSGFRVLGGSFGSPNTHATADVQMGSIGSGPKFFDLTFINVLFASATELPTPSSLPLNSLIKVQRYDQTATHKTIVGDLGVISYDASIFDVSPSVRLTPSKVNIPLAVTIRKKQVANGAAVTVTVKVRCSVVGDGAAYNGARPRLIQKAQPGAGTNADVVLDTATVASDGAWETLSGTIAAVSENCVIAFVVDCDGTTGWVNVDTLNVT